MMLPSILGLIVEVLERAGIPYMITGSVASSFHGAPRATRDVDVVIDPESAALDRLVEGLHSAAFYVDRAAAHDALRDRSQFNAIDATTGWKIDFVLRKDRPFSKAEFERRQRLELLGTIAWIATPEDMILAKLEWAAATGSDRQLQDVAAMVDVAGDALDIRYLDEWLAELGLREDWSRLQNRGA
ncbi:MAG: hypothetical protein AABZ33_09560 [Chloroflexota bacterium]